MQAHTTTKNKSTHRLSGLVDYCFEMVWASETEKWRRLAGCTDSCMRCKYEEHAQIEDFWAWVLPKGGLETWGKNTFHSFVPPLFRKTGLSIVWGGKKTVLYQGNTWIHYHFFLLNEIRWKTLNFYLLGVNAVAGMYIHVQILWWRVMAWNWFHHVCLFPWTWVNYSQSRRTANASSKRDVLPCFL